jgi:putative ABC transport system ATP-binding protein
MSRDVAAASEPMIDSGANSAISARALEKVYGRGSTFVRSLEQVSLEVRRGEFLCIMGPSGSGKSTLLHVLGGIERPTAGVVRIGDTDIQSLSSTDLDRFRRRNIGFVYQFFNLIPTLNVEENVALPLLLEGRRFSSVRDRVRSLLVSLKLEDRATHAPSLLSGGEMQRVAIARALVIDPRVILADEPTGNLDSQTGEQILTLLRQASNERAVTTVLVTHDLRAASYADRVVILRDGRIQDDVPAYRLARVE